MSWAVSVSPRSDREDLLSAVEHAEPGYDISEEATEQLRAAKEVAKTLVGMEVVGKEADALGVNLGGHANPGHGHAEVSAREMVTVTVTQAAADLPS